MSMETGRGEIGKWGVGGVGATGMAGTARATGGIDRGNDADGGRGPRYKRGGIGWWVRG